MSGAGTLVEPDSAVAAKISTFFGAPISVVLAGYESYSERLHGVAEEFTHDGTASATFLPTGSFGLRGPQWFAPEDPIHFNRSGAERMGRHMAEALLGLGLSPRTECAAAPDRW
jgi:lysophospholipase L1-like esterase